ncbi:ankyrin repeat-containing domain protein [Xylariomycetidae sp. FL2044]|nr:ankyrin repeat-containing domain protein [Xylariomycetidae sp. FL2044]
MASADNEKTQVDTYGEPPDKILRHSLFARDEYHQWHDSGTISTLWVEESPGTESFLLASCVIDYFRTQEKVPVISLHLDHHIQGQGDWLANLARAWMAQSLPHCQLLQTILRPLSRTALDQVPRDILWACLMGGLATVDRVYIVIDSVHEARVRDVEDAAAYLVRMGGVSPSRVKVLIIGRVQDRTTELFAASIPLGAFLKVSLDTKRYKPEERPSGVLAAYHRFYAALSGQRLSELDAKLGPTSSPSSLVKDIPVNLLDTVGILKSGFNPKYATEVVRAQLMRIILSRGMIHHWRGSFLHKMFGFVHAGVSSLEVLFEFTEGPDCFDFNELEEEKHRTAFHCACAMVILDAAYTIPANARMTPYETWYRATGLFLRMLRHGADALAVDDDNRNALHFLLNNPQMCEQHILAFLERPEAAKLVSAKDDFGSTPLLYGLQSLRPISCRRLLDLGADLMEAGEDGSTALHYLADQWLSLQPEYRSQVIGEKGDSSQEYVYDILSLWRKFISLGGSINAQDRQGNPPLFLYLAATGPRFGRQGQKKLSGICPHVEYFDIFFDAYDADLRIRNHGGQTALHIVAGRTRDESEKDQLGHDAALFSFLMDRGLDPFDRDAQGKNSLDVAREFGKGAILALFEDPDETVL